MKSCDLQLLGKSLVGVTLFLEAINCILGELGNRVDRSLFVDDLAIYITKNEMVATNVLQGITKKLDT